MGGAIFETAVLSEIVRTLTHRGIEPQVYFWRTVAGSEIDFIVHTDRGLVPIEAKLSSTPNLKMASSIRVFRSDVGKGVLPGFVIHPGSIRLPLGSGVSAIPFTDM